MSRCLVILFLLGACRGGDAPGLPAAGADGRWLAGTLQAFDGARVQALGVASGRPIVVALWASWCQPCIEEMPELSAFQAAHRDAVIVLGLSTHPPDEQRAVQQVFDQARPRYPQGMLQGGEGPFLDRLGLSWDGILPKTVLLRPDGRAVVLDNPVTRAGLEAALAPYLSR